MTDLWWLLDVSVQLQLRTASDRKVQEEAFSTGVKGEFLRENLLILAGSCVKRPNCPRESADL